jgi:hypothetical protein
MAFKVMDDGFIFYLERDVVKFQQMTWLFIDLAICRAYDCDLLYMSMYIRVCTVYMYVCIYIGRLLPGTRMLRMSSIIWDIMLYSLLKVNRISVNISPLSSALQSTPYKILLNILRSRLSLYIKKKKKKRSESASELYRPSDRCLSAK